MGGNENREIKRSRRSILATAGVCAGIIGISAGGSQVQTTTDPDGQAQIHTRAIIPQVGQPFEGEYIGQYITFTDPTPSDTVSATIVDECAFAE